MEGAGTPLALVAYSGAFETEELQDFSQDDLQMDDVYILDVYRELFAWVGNDANETERRGVMELSRCYSYAHVCSRILTYASVCSRILTYAELSRCYSYAHVCSRMLTYADVCSRMLS